MIQVNLIPELKAEYLRSQRTKRVVVSFAGLASMVFAGLVVLMLIWVYGVQRTHTNNLSDHISELTEIYQENGDIDKIVTVQRQLDSLPGLHSTKPLVSRIAGYMASVTPSTIEYTNYEISFEEYSMTIEGTADKVPDVNTYVDTLKNAQYTIKGSEDKHDPFSSVLLDNIETKDDETSFVVVLTFDPQIFTVSEQVNLFVPKINSTLSEVERPRTETGGSTDVFESGEDN